MKQKFIEAHMRTALVWADLSYAKRRKVGAVLAKDDNILSIGYNGTLPGEDNVCEIEVPEVDYLGNICGTNLVTHDGVIHAEHNCLAKMMKKTETSVGATLFVTLAPCIKCAREIVLAEVKEVFYLEEYRDMSGVEFLESRGIPCYKVNLEGH